VERGPRRERTALVDAPQAIQATKVRATEQGVEDLRRQIFTPLPSVDMDLGAALDVLAMRFGQHTGTPARVTLLGRTRAINRLHSGLLVRLAQEALLNVQQHAHAASATLTLRYDSCTVALLIQDDGVGLLDGTHERPGLHALRAMQYRLAEFGGRLDVFETEGGGVTVRATMPLE
jgi:signal transduction histidine kinase